jgi:hypothetical protein
LPQRFFALEDLRGYGVTRGDLKGPSTLPQSAWRLADTATNLLRPLLERTGFNINRAIHVRESQDPPGFVFTQ